jgi:hypothetical protein
MGIFLIVWSHWLYFFQALRECQHFIAREFPFPDDHLLLRLVSGAQDPSPVLNVPRATVHVRHVGADDAPAGIQVSVSQTFFIFADDSAK